MSIRGALVGLLVLVLDSLAACGGAGPRAGGDAAGNGEANAPLLERIYDYGMQFGEDRAAIREALGPPIGEQVHVAENRHVAGAIDSLFTLVYPDLTFEVNRPGPVAGELLIEARMTAPGREMPGGLRVGTTRDALMGRLGPPDGAGERADTTLLSYAVSGQAVDRYVTFFVVGDTLRGVAWTPYVD